MTPDVTLVEVTWRPGDTLPGDLREAHAGGMTWRRDTAYDVWATTTPEGELLWLPTVALLECCGQVTAMRLTRSAP